MPSITVYPSSYNTSDYSYSSVSLYYPLDRVVGKGSNNTTYTQWNLKTGSQAESWVYYNFDLSEIPANARITSVDCSAKVYVSQTNSNRISARTVQLYSDVVAKGSATTFSSSTTALNLSCGTWTREELNSCRIKIYNKRGTSSTTTTYYTRFYGATLIVNYEIPIPTYTVRFLDWDNRVLSIQTIEEGSNAIPPSNPIRDGYTFIGWNGLYNNVVANIDITAIYEENISLIKINIGDLAISDLYIGSYKVSKVYIGNTLIYDNSN